MSSRDIHLSHLTDIHNRSDKSGENREDYMLDMGFRARTRPVGELTPCAQCGDPLIAPTWAEHVNERCVRHLGQCEASSVIGRQLLDGGNEAAACVIRTSRSSLPKRPCLPFEHSNCMRPIFSRRVCNEQRVTFHQRTGRLDSGAAEWAYTSLRSTGE